MNCLRVETRKERARRKTETAHSRKEAIDKVHEENNTSGGYWSIVKAFLPIKQCSVSLLISLKMDLNSHHKINK